MTEGASNRKEARKARSRAAILASAAALLRARGIEASSVLDVMRGAGLTVGGFYGHFDSKEALFAATIRETARAKWDQLLATARGRRGVDKALDVARKYLSRAHRDRPEEGCLLPNAAPTAARAGGEPYREAIVDELEHFTASLGAWLEGPTARAGRERALGLIALMYGGLAISRALAGTTLSDEILASARKLAADALEGAGEGSPSRVG